MPKQRSKQADSQYDIHYMRDIIEFGQKVRARREEQHVSLDDLADKINSDKASPSRIENGERIPRLDKVLRIADALNTTPAKLCPSRYLDEDTANILPQIYKRLTRQSV